MHSSTRSRHKALVSLLALVALVVAAVMPMAPLRTAAAPTANGSPSVRVFTDAELRVAGSNAAQPAQAALTVLAGQTVGPLAGAAQLNWQVTASDALDAGRTVVRVRQTINDWPVFGAALALQVENGAIRTASGAYVRQPSEVAKPMLSAEAARRLAMRHLRNTPALHSEVNPEDDGHQGGDAFANARPRETELVYFEPTLFDLRTPLRGAAFRVLVEAGDGSEAATVIVDAATGKVVLAYTEWHSALQRTIRDAENIETLGGTVCASASGLSAAASEDCRAAFTNTGLTYNYFLEAHGRDSFDDNGAPMISVVRFGKMPNAFWNGELTVFGPGFATLDVVAHEWTHAVTQYSAGLIYDGQSGALNESMSDIFGAMVDGDDWLIGEETPIGAIRSLADPPLYGQPDRMSGYSCVGGDYGSVHYNSGIPNKLAYLLAEGGTFNGQSVTAIGRRDTAAIFYRTLIGSLTPSSTFNQLAAALVSSAETLFGVRSNEALQTRAAVDAVELDEAWPCSGANVEPDVYEIDDTPAQAGLLPNGGVVDGRNFHVAGDADFHVLNAAANTTYIIETTNIGYAADTVLTLYAADGRRVLAMNDDYGANLASRIAFTAEAAGLLYIRITNFGDGYGSGTEYALYVAAIDAVSSPDTFEPDNTRSSARRYVVNTEQQVRHFHVVGDVDWVAFSAEAGRRYVIVTTDVGMIADTVVELFDRDGSFLAENDESAAGYGAYLDFVAAESGDHFVRVSHFSDQFGSETQYLFSVVELDASTGDPHEPNNTSSTATLLNAGGYGRQEHSFHRPQDEDWLRIDLSANTDYVLETEMLAHGTDTVLEMYSSTGLLIAENDDYNGLASRLLIGSRSFDETVFVRVRNFSSNVGRPDMTYVVRLTVDGERVGMDAQEPDDTFELATPVIPGPLDAPTTLQYNFHQSGDLDFVRFNATAGSIYILQTQELEANADTVLFLLSSDGRLMAYDYGGGDAYPARIVWQAPDNGDYYLLTYNFFFWSPEGIKTGYQLAISATDGILGGDGYELDNSAAQANPLTVGDEGQLHTLHIETDEDWLAFSAEAGRSYDLLTDQLGPSVNTVLELYDVDGVTLLARSDNARLETMASRIQWRAEAAGTYFLRVLPYDGRNTGSGSDYRIRVLPLGDAYEPDDRAVEATPIEVDGAAQLRTLTAGDQDWLVFPAQAGTLYQVTTSDLGSCSDTTLELYRAADTDIPVAQNDDYDGRASRVAWTADTDDNIYVRVSHYFSVPQDSECASYSITVATAPSTGGDIYEPDNLMSSATEFTGVDQARSLHTAGDSDWVVVPVTAGTSYEIETLDLAPCTDTVLALYADDGTFLTWNDDIQSPERRSWVKWTAPWSGNLYLNVAGYSNGGGGEACTYTLRVTTASAFGPDAYEEDDSFDSVRHRITADAPPEARTFDTSTDEDWLFVTTTGGVEYSLQTLNLGWSTDTVLTLYRRDNRGGLVFVAESDDDWSLPDRFASQIRWTAVNGYQYVLRVRPWASTGGRDTSTYQLAMTSMVTTMERAAVATPGDGRLQMTDVQTQGVARVGSDFSVVVSAVGQADTYKLSVDSKASGLELVAVEPMAGSGQAVASPGGWAVAQSGRNVTVAAAAPSTSRQAGPLVRLRWRVTGEVDSKYVHLPISLTATAADGRAWLAGTQVATLPVAGDVEVQDVSPREVTLDGDAEVIIRVTGLAGEVPKVFLVDTVTQAVQQVSSVSPVEGSTELLRLMFDRTIKSGRYKVRIVAETETEFSTQTLRLNAPDNRLFVPNVTR